MVLIPHNQWTNRPEYEAAALRVLRSGHVAQGPETEAFEHELAAKFRPNGAAVCVSSGTAALYLVLKAVGTGARDEDGKRIDWVSVPSYSCSALANAVRMADANVAVVDIDAESFNATKRANVYYHAAIRVHTYGVPVSMNTIADTISIEDMTQAPGATLDGKPCGSLGDLSVISFGATKPIGVGAGGAILGPKDEIAEIKKARDYDGSTSGEAFNWSMPELYAAMGRERLKRLDEENRFRWAASNVYCHAIPHQDMNHQAAKEHGPDGRVWYRYVLRLRQVEEARKRFAEAGIETIVPLRTDELLGAGLDKYPNAEEIARTTLSLPIWPGMTREMVHRVADCLASLGDLE